MLAGESGAQPHSRRRCRKAAADLYLSGDRSPGEVKGSQAAARTVCGERPRVDITLLLVSVLGRNKEKQKREGLMEREYLEMKECLFLKSVKKKRL